MDFCRKIVIEKLVETFGKSGTKSRPFSAAGGKDRRDFSILWRSETIVLEHYLLLEKQISIVQR